MKQQGHPGRGERIGSERLPLRPLLDILPIDYRVARRDIVGPGVIAQAATLLGVSTRSIHRWRHTGVNPWTADRLAIAAGLHPLSVWGDAWIQAIDIEHVLHGREHRRCYESPSLSR